ncbi:MAG: DUF4412 domain-containing protein [Bacteroidia bacterium]
MKQQLLLVFFFCMVLGAFAQPGTVVNPPVKADSVVDSFEGTLEYVVEIKGPESGFIMENEPNTRMQMHIKDNNYIVKLLGGRYPKMFMYVADSNYEYSLDLKDKRAFRASAYNNKEMKPMAKRPAAKPTGKVEKVNGIECQIYQSEHDSAKFTFYVSDKYRVNKRLFKVNTRAQANYLVNGLNGRIPLKIIKREKGLMMTTTLKSIKPEKFEPEQFRIPPDFTVYKMDRRY